jgi:hypothetical protein
MEQGRAQSTFWQKLIRIHLPERMPRSARQDQTREGLDCASIGAAEINNADCALEINSPCWFRQ